MSRAEEREDADCVCSVGMKFTWDINDPKLPQVTDQYRTDTGPIPADELPTNTETRAEGPVHRCS